MRDYYFKKKRDLKGQSGKKRTNVKTWIYFNSLRFLDNCAAENESTIDNISTVDTMEEGNSESDFNLGGEVSESTLQSRQPVDNRPKPKKKKSESVADQVNSKILEQLNKDTSQEDGHYHFCMSLASRLRKMTPSLAGYAEMKISQMMFELEFPSQRGQPPASSPYSDDELLNV